MKIALGSDLHLEMGDLVYIKPDCDVLVLAGDVLVAQDLYKSQRTDKPSARDLGSDTVHSRTRRYRDFLTRISNDFEQVVVVAGNHEYYHGFWERTVPILKDEYNHYPNIHFLENQNWVYQGVQFCGTTLWTDFDKDNPIARYHCGRGMNDYHVVRSGENYWKITTDYTYNAHVKAMNWLNSVAADLPTVVVSHMAPHPNSIHNNYRGDLLNAAYHSNLDEWIVNHPFIKLWCHGHTHHTFDYYVDKTRVVCNPRGYLGQDADPNYQFKVITL